MWKRVIVHRRPEPARRSKRNRLARRIPVLEHLEERALLAALPSLSPAGAADWAIPTDIRYLPSDEVTPLSTAGPTGYTPAQIRTAYGFNNVSFGTTAADGTGTTIAIVDAYDDPNIAHDLQQFDAQFGLPNPTFTKVNQTGGTTYPAANAGWITEIALDVEWSHAVAPGASILLVEANSASNSDLLTAVDYARHAAGVVVVSMSWGGGESPSEASSDSYFTTPSGHAGVTFLASSGDSGAPPSYPSISPNVVSVGGTTLNLGAGGSYGSEAGWSGSGGGISSYESQPAYQKGVVTQSTTMRTNPDVAYDANPSTGFPVYDSFNNGTLAPWGQWGGTSDAAPQWAALVAIADQGRALGGAGSLNGVTQTLPLLYTALASHFHDITTGGSAGFPIYSAGPGYDLATGRGTPYAAQIIGDLGNADFTSTTLGVSAGTITYGQPVTLTATVSVVPPGTGTPSGGTVTFMDYGTAIGSAPLAGGSAAFTTSTLGYGVHQLTASYSGYGTSFWPSSTPSGLSSASIVTTVAGEGLVDGVQATAATLSNPSGTAMDWAGDLFVADTADNRVREVNHATGLITTVAGSGTAGYSGDGGPATAAMLHAPTAVALDSAGNLYLADTSNSRIRKVNLATGVITTVAGNGAAGYSGDGGAATAAELSSPQAITLDASGDLFIADGNNQRIREVNLSSGLITTVAGGGVVDGRPATTAPLNNPLDVVADAAGDLFIADANHNRVREVNHASGLITTVAGTGTAGYSGDGGPASAAGLSDPTALALDASGNLFIVDGGNDRIREVNLGSGVITTVAGDGNWVEGGDGGAATSAGMSPAGVAVDAAGNIYISDSNRVREVNHATGIINTVAGTGAVGYGGDNGQATAASLDGPAGVALDAAGNLYIADQWNDRIREVNHLSGIITTVAGDGGAFFTGDGGPATAATLWLPSGVAIDSLGDLFIADSFNSRVREVRISNGTITTVAGNGSSTFNGDGQAATSAGLSAAGVALDSAGNLYIADSGDNRIREVNLSSGLISTAAGNGSANYGGDGGAATAAAISGPQGLAVDAAGDLYIADSGNNCIRKVNLSTGAIATVAGMSTLAGYNGDGIQATAASLNDPLGLALDASGNLFIADYDNFRIRELNASNGTIATVAGNGSYGFGGDGQAATAAKLDYPRGVALDAAGNLYIADSGNNRIRTVNHGTGAIATFAGGFVGDGGAATAAALVDPSATAVDSFGDIFIVDTGDNRVREINGATGAITTVAGTGATGYNGDGIQATAATLSAPCGVAVDLAGNLYIADSGNNRIREVNHATGLIATVAGNGTASYGGDNGRATAAEIDDPCGVAVDQSGDLFIADCANNRVREVKLSTGIIVTVAGTGTPGYNHDGIQATAAELNGPTGVTVDSAGNLYIADRSNDRVRKVIVSSGVISTVAGNGSAGYAGDGGVATAASLNQPKGLAVDAAGNLYVADYGNNRIRMVIASTGIISTIGGGSTAGFGGDGGAAGAALLASPSGVAMDAAGNLYVADSGNNRIRRLAVGGDVLIVNPAAAASTSITLGLSPTATYGGSLSLSATLLSGGIAVSGESISFTFHGTFLASGVTNAAGVASLATASAAGYAPGTYSGYLGANFSGTSLWGASGVTANLTITQAPLTIAANNVNKVYAAADPAYSAAYSGFVLGQGPANLGGTLAFSTNEPATGYAAAGPYTVTPSGLTSGNYAIAFAGGTLTVVPAATSALVAAPPASVYGRAVTLTATVTAAPPCAATPTGGTVTFMDGGKALGTATLSGGTAMLVTTALTAGSQPLSAVYNGDGADFAASAAGGIITTVAGNGTAGYGGDGGPAIAAMLSSPYAVAVDASGNIFIADASNNVVREVNSATGTITTVAGDGSVGDTGDGGKATAATLDEPYGVAVDGSGHLFIADAGNNRVREVNLSSGLITTLAGGGSTLGDGGPATAAMLSTPYAVFADGSGHLFIGDFGDDRVREVNLANGMISTVAGDGVAGYSGDGGQATAAELNYPEGIAADANGNLFIADQGNACVREVNLSTGVITTVAGTGISGYSGDGGPATAAEISYPRCVAVDASGDLFISDTNNARIREVNLRTGLITTVVGNGTAGYGGDGGPATAAEIDYPRGIAVDASGRLFIADMTNDRIREILPANTTLVSVSPAPLTVTANVAGRSYGSTDPAFSASYLGFVNGDNSSNLGGTLQFTTTEPAGGHTPAGTYQIITSGLTSTNYAITFVPGTLTVSPAPLTVTADNQSKVYGAADPNLTFSSSGTLYYGDQYSVISGVTLSTATGAAATAGTHPITASGATAANYAINFAPGTLTVSPAPLTVTADNQSKVYGGADSSLTSTASGTLYYGDQYSVIGGVVLSTATGAAATVGTYPITASGGTAANYAISFASGVLAVTPAPLTVTADNQSKVYGAADPNLTFSSSGTLYYGDQYSVISGVTLSTATGAAAAAGTYPITASGATAANYAITFVPGTLTVTQAPLTVTADNQSKVYGATDPNLTFSSSGTLYYGDQYSVISGVTLSTATGAAATAGTHPITASGATAANYAINFVPGTLTVSQAPLTVTADNQSKTYGSADPAFSASCTGFVYSDNSGSLGGTAAFATGEPASGYAPAGAYQIVPSGLTSPNYAITFADGALTVNPAPLTVTAANEYKVYGSADPAFTTSIAGLAAGENAANLGGTPAFTTTEPTSGIDTVGAYSVTPAGYTSGNYAITFVPGTLTVSPAPLMVIADNENKVYGGADPALVYSVVGTFYYGDSSSVISGVTLSTATGAAATAGTHTITAAGGTAANYSIADYNATLTVAPAPLSVTAANQSKPFGAADPAFSASSTGYVYGDNPSSFGGALAFATNEPTTGNAPVGSYAIRPSGWTSANYAITFASGTLSVLPDPTTVALFNSAGSAFFLKDSCGPGAADDTVPYGPPGAKWEPIVGDWTGNGVTTLGLYNPVTSTFFLKNTNSAGAADLTFNYGPADPGYNGTTNLGWTPLAGDWNDDGTTSVGLYNPATGIFYLKNTNSAGPADLTFGYGPGGPGWTPITGDWNGDGTTSVGLYNSASGLFFLKDSNSAGPADLTFQYGPGGNLGWTPLAGVWNGSHATVGLYVPASGTFLLKDTNSAGSADVTFGYGPGGTGWTPLIGGWTCPSSGSPDLSRASGVAPMLVNAGAAGLTTAALEPVVQQAIAASGTGSANVVGQDLQEHWQSQWRPAGPSSAALVPTVDTQVALGSAPGGALAEPSPAADSGGLVDPMPAGGQELGVDTSVSPLPVLDPRAVDQLDLLAVVEQELGQS